MNKDCDIDTFVTTTIELPDANHNHDHDELDAEIGDIGLVDLFAPLEILHCQSIIDYLQNSPNILSRLLID